MYRRSYAKTLEDCPKAARAREREALQRAIRKLSLGKLRGAGSPEAAEALICVRQLWTFLIENLADEENGLPDALRASLISIGLWIQREAALVESGRSTNFDGLIEVNQLIADGLL
jgi:flagellar protein FlaF